LLANADFSNKLNSQGFYPVIGASAKFVQVITEENSRVKAIAKSAKIELEL
jgi:tripartite-type tricarboxylate transporter receptor subunit TctC